MDPELRTRPAGGDDLPVLVWRFGSPRRAIATAALGGGIGPCRWVLNAQVESGYDRLDPSLHLAELAADLGLAGRGVGLLTAADVRRATRGDDSGVRVVATVGLGQPLLAAAPGGAGPLAVHRAGTINVVAMVPEALGDAALVNAVATATEAKVQALLAAGHRATGTATDAVCIVCPTDGPVHDYGGPRSTWGAPLARAVHAAVLAGARC